MSGGGARCPPIVQGGVAAPQVPRWSAGAPRVQPRPGEAALVGWFYECDNATDPMPMRGRYVDIDRCLYAPVDDVHEMHEEYLVKQEAKMLPWG